ASYYLAPIGEVLRLALPALERDTVRALAGRAELAGLDAKRQVGGRKILVARPTAAVEAPGSLRGQAAGVLALLRADGETAVARIEERFGNARAALARLEAKGLVEMASRAPDRPVFDSSPRRDTPPELNAGQLAASRRLEAALRGEPGPRAFLLF